MQRLWATTSIGPRCVTQGIPVQRSSMDHREDRKIEPKDAVGAVRWPKSNPFLLHSISGGSSQQSCTPCGDTNAAASAATARLVSLPAYSTLAHELLLEARALRRCLRWRRSRRTRAPDQPLFTIIASAPEWGTSARAALSSRPGRFVERTWDVRAFQSAASGCTSTMNDSGLYLHGH